MTPRWILAAWGGFLVVGGAGGLASTMDVNSDAFLLACGAVLAGFAFVVRGIDFREGRERGSDWRYVVASALGGGLIAAGASVLGLFTDVAGVGPWIAWGYIAAGTSVIAVSAVMLRR